MIKNLFTKNECNEIISFSENENQWEKKTNGVSYQIFIFKPDEFISDKIMKYAKEILGLSILTVNLAVLKYIEGDYFPRHTDRAETTFNRDFLYNINLKLNDEYEGGEFLLNDKVLVADVGDVYHYKSTEFHEVKPITKGTRYTGLFYLRERDIGISKII
jgi:Rps23 Pro-64 3,4-dihydroxylase Tpa1-like proline 4-hydroxylase